MRRLLVVLALLALARPAAAHILSPTLTPLALTRLALAATPPPPTAAVVRIVNYTMPNGMVIPIHFLASTPEQRRRIEDLAERLMKPRLNDGSEVMIMDADAGGNAEWGYGDLQVSIADGISLACAFVSGAAQSWGYVNVWLDGVNALCLSFTVIDLGARVLNAAGNWIYNAYLASVKVPAPTVPPFMWSLYMYGGLPIF